MDPSTLAIDIGGSKIAAALVDGPTVTETQVVTTPAREGREAILAAVLDLGRAVLAGARGPVREVGISSAGIVEPGTGRITHATDLLRGWAGTPLADRVADGLGLPVVVLNDVHAHGVGETLGGAADGCRRALVVAIGTGIGGCLVVDGRPEVGARGVAGHIGHVPAAEASDLTCSCGRTGHLEALASGSGVRTVFERRTGRDLPTAEIAALASGAAGDASVSAAARAVLTESGRAAGRVVGGLLNVLDPDAVVIGGGMSGAGTQWRLALVDGIACEAMDAVAQTPLRFSDSGADAALRGAARYARTSLRPTTEEIP